MDQARLEWRVLRDGKGNLSAGRFYVPFGIERFSYSSPRNKLVDRPAPFRRIFPGTYSDTGLLAEGALALPHGVRLRYEAAATFGLGRHAPTQIRDARQGADNNRDPQVSGRLGLDLGHGLEVGASGLRGRWDDDARERIEMVGVDAVWKPGPLDVRGEWVESRAEQPGRDVHRRGFYAQASLHLPLGAGAWLEEVEPVVRFDGIRANSPLPDVPRLRRVAAGLDFHLTGNAIAKVQVERIDNGRRDASNHGILAQLSIHW